MIAASRLYTSMAETGVVGGFTLKARATGLAICCALQETKHLRYEKTNPVRKKPDDARSQSDCQSVRTGAAAGWCGLRALVHVDVRVPRSGRRKTGIGISYLLVIANSFMNHRKQRGTIR